MIKNWNYRVLHFITATESWFAVHEVYYGEDGEPNSYAENEESLLWDAEEGDRYGIGLLDMMRVAFEKPVLMANDFV